MLIIIILKALKAINHEPSVIIYSNHGLIASNHHGHKFLVWK